MTTSTSNERITCMEKDRVNGRQLKLKRRKSSNFYDINNIASQLSMPEMIKFTSQPVSNSYQYNNNIQEDQTTLPKNHLLCMLRSEEDSYQSLPRPSSSSSYHDQNKFTSSYRQQRPASPFQKMYTSRYNFGSPHSAFKRVSNIPSGNNSEEVFIQPQSSSSNAQDVLFTPPPPPPMRNSLRSYSRANTPGLLDPDSYDNMYPIVINKDFVNSDQNPIQFQNFTQKRSPFSKMNRPLQCASNSMSMDAKQFRLNRSNHIKMFETSQHQQSNDQQDVQDDEEDQHAIIQNENMEENYNNSQKHTPMRLNKRPNKISPTSYEILKIIVNQLQNKKEEYRKSSEVGSYNDEISQMLQVTLKSLLNCRSISQILKTSQIEKKKILQELKDIIPEVKWNQSSRVYNVLKLQPLLSQILITLKQKADEIQQNNKFSSQHLSNYFSPDVNSIQCQRGFPAFRRLFSPSEKKGSNQEERTPEFGHFPKKFLNFTQKHKPQDGEVAPSSFNSPYIKKPYKSPQISGYPKQKIKYINNSFIVQYETPQARRFSIQNDEKEMQLKQNQEYERIDNLHLSNSAQTMSSTPGHRISVLGNQFNTSQRKKTYLSPKILIGQQSQKDPFISMNSSSQNMQAFPQFPREMMYEQSFVCKQESPSIFFNRNSMGSSESGGNNKMNRVTDFQSKINEDNDQYEVNDFVKKQEEEQEEENEGNTGSNSRMMLRKSRIEEGHSYKMIKEQTSNDQVCKTQKQKQKHYNQDEQYQGLKNISIQLFSLIFGRMLNRGLRKFQKKNIASELVYRFRTNNQLNHNNSHNLNHNLHTHHQQHINKRSSSLTRRNYKTKNKLYRFYPTKYDISQNLDPGQYEAVQKADKNVRRRVYDAINVLLAVDVLEQTVGGKDVTLPNRLKGLSRLLFLKHERKHVMMNDRNGFQPQSQLRRIKNLKQQKLFELAQKKQQLKMAIHQNFNLKNLKKRNSQLVLQRAQKLRKMNIDNGVKEDTSLKILSELKDSMDSNSSQSTCSPKLFVPNNPLFHERLLLQPYLILYTVSSEESSLKITKCKGEQPNSADSILLKTTYPHTIKNLLNFLQFLNLHSEQNFEKNMKKLLRMRLPQCVQQFLKLELDKHINRNSSGSSSSSSNSSSSNNNIRVFADMSGKN